uniref:RING-type domain-containing protein n=1 Tax=Phasianus colchicus TaxID=9054 RepID=A0A669QKB2_PHACC
ADIAYVIPCNHMFCTGCILQWAMLRNSCPLCRTVMQTIRVSVPGGNLTVQTLLKPQQLRPCPPPCASLSMPTALWCRPLP